MFPYFSRSEGFPEGETEQTIEMNYENQWTSKGAAGFVCSRLFPLTYVFLLIALRVTKAMNFVEFSDDREADGKFSHREVTQFHIIVSVLDAVRRGDGRRVDGRRIIVDRELGRTKANWYPRRLGGGKGEARRDRRDEELLRDIKR